MARASEQEQKGSTGVSEVTAKFSRLGWGHAEITRHDNGTDLFLMARDARRFDLGLTVGVQVKAGPSYFKEPARDDQGRLLGWWFRDSDSSHVTDWLRHGLPHLVVIHDLDSHTSYWVHVTGDAVVSTGAGSKILVPITNTVDEAHRDDLLAVAATLRPAATWEGSVWQGVTSLPVKDHLRHALLVPRLIAPHPNARPAHPISPVQGVALLMQARVRDFERFAEEHEEVPTLTEATSSDDWTWRFVGLLGKRVTTGDVDVLQQSLDDAPDAASRVAATVTAVAGLLEEDRPDAAIGLLEAALELDDAEPVDHAWLSVQYARALAEVGCLEDARAQAAAVQSLRATHPDDVTATALAGVAAQLLFNVSGWKAGDLAGAIMGADTAASWWRQLTRSWGLSAAIDRIFQRWARDTTHRWSVGDAANDQLLAASLTATLAGSRDDWRDLTSLLGRDMLIRLNRMSEASEAADGLATLRLAGDPEAVKLATRRLVSDGPSLAATEAASQIDLHASTRTTGPTNLTLLQEAGGVLNEATADSAVTWLLSTLDNDAGFVARTIPSYLVDARLIDTVAGVLPSASENSRRSVAEYVLQLEPEPDQLLATSWSGVLRALDGAWRDSDAEALVSGADRHHDVLRLTLRGVAAKFDDAVRTALLDDIRASSADALGQFGDVRQLPKDVVQLRVAYCVEALGEIAASAAQHSFGFGGVDSADELTLLSMWHPAEANWDALLTFIKDGAVAGRDKVRAVQRMARQIDQVPSGIKPDLGVIAAELAGSEIEPTDGMLGSSVRAPGAGAMLCAALGASSPADAAADMHRLLAGEAEDRVWAARIARSRGARADVGALTVLVHDESPNVRAAAAAGLAALSVGDGGDALVEAGLRAALSDPGLRVPQALAGQLTMKDLSAEGRTVLEELRSHAHASVRRLAQG